MDQLNETLPTKSFVIRDGKKEVKYSCPSGYKLQDGRCVLMSAVEQRNRSRGAKAAARTTEASSRRKVEKQRKSMEKRDRVIESLPVCSRILHQLNEYDYDYSFELNSWQERLIYRLSSRISEFILAEYEEVMHELSFLLKKDGTEKFILEYVPKNKQYKYIVYTPKNPKDKKLYMTVEQMVTDLLGGADTMTLDIEVLYKG